MFNNSDPVITSTRQSYNNLNPESYNNLNPELFINSIHNSINNSINNFDGEKIVNSINNSIEKINSLGNELKNTAIDTLSLSNIVKSNSEPKLELEPESELEEYSNSTGMSNKLKDVPRLKKSKIRSKRYRRKTKEGIRHYI